MNFRCSSLNIQLRTLNFMEIEISSFFLIDVFLGVDRKHKFPNLNLVRALAIMHACSAIHLGLISRFVFKFIRIRVDGENIESNTKTIV